MKKQAKKETMLHDALIMKLQALYDIESELVKALPKMAKGSRNPELKAGFKDHLVETENQILRLKDAFALLGEKPKKLKVDAIRGLAKDGAWAIKNVAEPAHDSVVIASARYVEHYEMAGYLSAISWAEALGYDDVTELLQQTLVEEKGADEKLSMLAISKIDPKAMAD